MNQIISLARDMNAPFASSLIVLFICIAVGINVRRIINNVERDKERNFETNTLVTRLKLLEHSNAKHPGDGSC